MILILNYHSVGSGDYRYSVTPEELRSHLAYIKKKFQVVSMLDFEKILFSGKYPKENIALITFDDGLKDNFTEAFNIIKEENVPATIFFTAGLAGGELQTKDGPKKMMEWGELIELAKSPLVTIGSHGLTHTPMTTLSLDAQDYELRESQRLIEKNVGVKVRFLAYPKGDKNQTIENTASKHYSLAFGSRGVILTFNKVNSFALPRVIVDKDTPMWKIKVMSYSWTWALKAYYDQVKKNFLGV